MARLVADLDSARAETAARRLHSEMLRLGDAARTVDARFSKAEVGTREYGRAQAALQRALNRGVIDQKEYNRLLQVARERYIDAAKGAAQYGRELQQFGRQMSSVGTQLTQKVTLPLVAVGGIAIKSFADFDRAMNQSLAIMGDVDDALRSKMTSAARQMAKETVFSATQAAESYFFLASAGLDAQSSVAALPTVAKFAQAGMFDMARATDLLTDAQSALGLTIRDDAIANMENMIRVSDVLVRANVLANATVEQFSTSLTTEAGAALKSFNIDVEEGVAVLAAFADQGVKGEVAGTGLSRILRLMTSAAVNNAAAYRELEVAVFDSGGKIRNLADIIADLEGALGNLSDEQRVAALESLGFQARVQGVILPLLGTSDAIRRYETELRSAAGYTDEVSSNQLKSFTNQMKLVRDEILDVAIELGSTLAPQILEFTRTVVVPAIKGMADMAESFGKLSGPAKGAVVVFFGVTAAIGPLLFVSGQLVTSWGMLIIAAPKLAAGIRLVVAAAGPVALIAAGLAALGLAAHEAIERWARSSEQGMADIIAANNRAKESVRQLREELAKGIITEATFTATVNRSAQLGIQIQNLEEKLDGLNRARTEALGNLQAGPRGSTNFGPLETIRRQSAEAEEQLANLRSELAVVDNTLKRAATSGVEFEEAVAEVEAATGGATGGVSAMTDALAEALKGMQASIATQEALRSALLRGGDAHEVLNTLLGEGVPLADALSGRYDEMARTLIETNRGLEQAQETIAKWPEPPPTLLGLPGLFQRIGQEAANINKIFGQQDRDAWIPGLAGLAVEMANFAAHTQQVFAGATQSVQDVDAAVRELRQKEVDRRAILSEIGRLLDAGLITQKEAVKIADQLGVEYSAMSEIIAEMGREAWRNIQDAAAESIVNIFDHYIKTGNEALDSFLKSSLRMLAELFLAWAANAAKRILLEKAVSASVGDGADTGGGGGGWLGALSKLFKGGGTQGSTGATTGVSTGAGISGGVGAETTATATTTNSGWWSTLASSGVLTAAAIAGVVVAWAYWNHKRKEKEHAQKFNEVVSLTDGATKIQGAAFDEERFLEMARQAQTAFRSILDAIGGEISKIPDIAIEAQNSGKKFRAIVAGEIIATVSTYEEALELAMLHALRQSDFSEVSQEFVNAIKGGTITSIDQLMEVAAVFQEISATAGGEVVQAMDALDAKLAQMSRTLEEAGISASVLDEYAAKSYQEIRDQITGVTKSARELFEEQRAAYNERIEQQRAELEATVAIEQGKIAALTDQIKLYQMLIAAGEAAVGISADLASKLATAQAALGAAQAAADAAQTALAGLPDLIGAGEFQGGKGRGTRKSDLEQLRDLLDQMSFDRTLAGMTALEAGRARLARQYEEEARRAHGNADLIRQLAEEYAFLNAELTRQIQLAAVDTFQGFLGIGEDPFSGLRDRWEEARAAVEEAGFGAERTARMLGRLDGAFRTMLDTLSQEQFVSIGDGLMGILETYYGGVQGFEQFRMDLERVRFELELANLRVQFEILKAQGTLSEAVLERMAEVFNFIDANPIDWDAFVTPRVPTPAAVTRFDRSVDSAASAAQALADRLARAKESIGEFLASLDRGEQGGVSTMEGLAAARAQFAEVFTQAKGGNIAAIEQFPQVAQNLLQLAREAYASSPEFQAIFEMVRASGEALLSVRRVTEDNVVFDERFFQAQNATTAATTVSAEKTVNAVHEGAARTSAAVTDMGRHVADAVNRQGAEQASRLNRIEQSLNAALAGQQRRKGAA